MLKDVNFVNKTNILDFIIECAIKLDTDNLPGEGRWMTMPGWMLGMLHRSDIKEFEACMWEYPYRDRMRIGVIDRFVLHQGTDQDVVRFGSIFCPEGYYYENVREGEIPLGFDEWNW